MVSFEFNFLESWLNATMYWRSIKNTNVMQVSEQLSIIYFFLNRI